MKAGKIYIITNDVNDKVYIGQTVQSLNRRLSQHFCKSKTRNQKISIAISDIAKEVGLSGTAIRNWIKKFNL